jgi:cell division protein ZapD
MSTSENNTIIYEQPINEHIRVCLRLEHLFQQAEASIVSASSWDSKLSLSAILQALNIIDRPDLKTKLAKALNQYAANLIQLQENPNVDQFRLEKLLHQLDTLVDSLYAMRGRFGQNLRDNEFLNIIRLHLGNPGGACPFSTPAFHLWLQQPSEIRQQDLLRWLKEFEQLKEVVLLLLQITRSSNIPAQKLAKGGFYQQNFEPSISYQLVQVVLAHDVKLYPEISVGQHGVSIRFFELNTADHARDIQTKQDVTFTLTCCKI